jgi:hypothetical protein
MSNQDTKRLAMAQALRSAFHKEVQEEETPTNEQISQILMDNGEDPDAVAKQYQDLVAEKIRAVKKARMLGFRAQPAAHTGFALRGLVPSNTAPLPTIETMRARIVALSSTPDFDRSTLAIAYRNGTKQSNSDILSLYEDLLELGVIKDDLET